MSCHCVCPHCCTSPSTPHMCMCVLLVLCQSGPQPLNPRMCVCACVCLVMLCPLSRSCLLPWHLPSQFIYFCLFLFSVFLYRFFFVFCFCYCCLLLLILFVYLLNLCVVLALPLTTRKIYDHFTNVFFYTHPTQTHTHTSTRIHTCVCVQYISTYSVFMLVDFLRPAALYMRAAMRFDRNWHKRT